MKKIFSAIVIISLLFSLTILAQQTSDITVTVDGKAVSFDVKPQIINDRTMVPIRAIFNALGAEVQWDDSTKTVTASRLDTTVKATIGSSQITVNDLSKTIDSAPVIIQDRALVPVRFISENFGADVDWNASTKTVVITTNATLEVHFIDVGQADSALITCGAYSMLVDGGNKADGETVYNYLKAQGIDYLDYVICTHGHEDHVGGLPYVLENIAAGTVIADDNKDTKIFKTFMDVISQKNIPVQSPKAGATFSLGNAKIEILGPVKESYSDYNDNSVVFRLDHEDNSFLFTGDSGYLAESDIIATNANLDIDVLKVGHHGSSTASSAAFLDLTTPEYAIISCGVNNSYGHPHKETLAVLYNRGIISYRTDELGSITAVSDGEDIKFNFEKNSPTASPTQGNVQFKPTSVSPSVAQTSQAENSYIGNKSTKKLHTPSCSSLPSEKNRVYFNSMQAALSQGYTACRNCKPS